MRLLPLVLLFACRTERPTVPDHALLLPGPTGWPARTSSLADLPLVVPGGFGTRRIFVDAGHGNGDNTGALTAWCEHEADVVLGIGQDLADRLQATGVFEVRLSREDVAGPSYARRVDEATAWSADALLSLHVDSRGDPWSWSPRTGESCLREADIPGFSVLVADKGEAPLVEGRLGLARSLSGRLGEAGFLPYAWGYAEKYDFDPTPGVYLDRRVLFLLRTPTMPSVIIETHNGIDLEERARWSEDRTRRAFAAAVAQALVDALH